MLCLKGTKSVLSPWNISVEVPLGWVGLQPEKELELVPKGTNSVFFISKYSGLIKELLPEGTKSVFLIV